MPLSAERHRAVSYHRPPSPVKRQNSPTARRWLQLPLSDLGKAEGGLLDFRFRTSAKPREGLGARSERLSHVAWGREHGGGPGAVDRRFQGRMPVELAVAAANPVAGAAHVVVVRE